MKVHWGKVHVFVGMNMDFSTKGEVHITMLKHLDDAVTTFENAQTEVGDGFIEVKRSRSKSQLTAAPTDLFEVNEKCEKLPKKAQEYFHCVTAKLINIWKHARPDIGSSVSFLTKRVRNPNKDDWQKLSYVIFYLKGDRNRVRKLGADDSKDLMWYVDCAFGVHC